MPSDSQPPRRMLPEVNQSHDTTSVAVEAYLRMRETFSQLVAIFGLKWAAFTDSLATPQDPKPYVPLWTQARLPFYL